MTFYNFILVKPNTTFVGNIYHCDKYLTSYISDVGTNTCRSSYKVTVVVVDLNRMGL
jgi:hypothetical protein